MLIEVRSNILGFILTAYNNSGVATWYFASAPYNSTDGTASGTLTELGNGQTISGPYVAPTMVNANVGPFSIRFTSSTSGTLTLPSGQQVPITKQTW
jgi:hypothetical protein